MNDAIIAIRYTGKKPEETDAYTGFTWSRGQVHDVPVEKAKYLLWHPEFRDARPAATQKRHPIEPEQFIPVARNFDEAATMPVNFNVMDEASLQKFSQARFNRPLESADLNTMRREAARLEELTRA